MNKNMQICEAIELQNVVEREKLMTEFPAIDTLTGGIYTGELTGILGSCESGKTSLLVAIASEMAVEQKLPILFFQMYGTHQAFFEYLASYACNLAIEDVHFDRLAPRQRDEIKAYMERLKNAPFYMGDRNIANFDGLRYALETFREQGNPIKVLFIDDIFLMEYDFKKERYLGYGLHRLAEEYNCAVIVSVEAYQSFEREGLEGIMPQLADCYYFGLDTYSDVILSMVRFDEWNIYQDENGNDLHNIVELRLLKKLGKHNKPRVRVHRDMLANKEKILAKVPLELQPIVKGLNLEPVSETF